MIPRYDTVSLQDEIAKILDKYKPEDTPLPDIESENFLEVLQKYNEKISSDCRMKMNILMVILGYAEKNVSSKLYELIEKMINECDKHLTPEEKEYLKWENKCNSEIESEIKSKSKPNPNSYNFIPKPDTIDKWLNSKRIPNRLSLYKICFALNLPLYLYDDVKNMDMQGTKYILSANYLFNKVYNQRYSSKEADELIFVYQLINSVHNKCQNSYLQAMKMLASYRKKSMLCQNEAFFYDDKSTILIIGRGIEMLPEAFVDFLSQLSPILDIRHSAVNKKIESIIQKFTSGERTKQFLEKYYDSNSTLICGTFNSGNAVVNSVRNMADYVLISSILKRNMEFLNKRLELCSVIHSNNYNSRRISRIKEVFLQYGISDNIFEYMNNFKVPYTKDIIMFLIKEIMLTEKEVYGIFGEDKKNTSAQIYEKTRNVLIITHFLDYWSGLDYDPEYEDYKLSINNILMKFGYMPMYAKSLFDSFFLLCAQLKDPVISYYRIIDKIVTNYRGFQNSFLSSVDESIRNNYNPLSANTPIMKYSEMADCIDDTYIQKELLKPIK